jgi:hypothetical protein
LWGLVDKGLHKPKVLLTVKTCSNFFPFILVVRARFQRGKITKNCCIPFFKRPSNSGGNIGAGLLALNVKGQHNDNSCLSHVKCLHWKGKMPLKAIESCKIMACRSVQNIHRFNVCPLWLCWNILNVGGAGSNVEASRSSKMLTTFS